ncbi:MAG: hypothetical protein ABI905_12215, partial [Betaproteobacteria bacterium]
DTIQNMQKVEDALVSFVSTTQRLPCPADGSLDSGNGNAGLEQRSVAGTCDAMTTGVVPWRSLGINVADVLDGWQGMLTYRVKPHLTIDGGMNMANCDPAGTGPVALGTSPPLHLCAAPPTCVGTALNNCTPPATFLTGKGFEIRNLAGAKLADPAAIPPTGAAFVLISAGPTLGPAYNVSGILIPTTAVVGTGETTNQNNQALQGYYVDDQLNVTPDATHFDDIVRRPSISTIVTKANLGPRAHF